jgi:glycopeptide antibiotics resistance protein
VSRAPARLWIVWTLFIVYACTIPFHFSADTGQIAARLRYGVIYPFEAHDPFLLVSVPDFIGNILLFVPFGVLGAITLRARTRWWFARVVLLGFVLSAFDEALQLLTVDRVAALSDVLANTVGAAVGAIVYPGAVAGGRRALRPHGGSGLVTAPAFYPALVALIAAVVSVWEPFSFSTDLIEIAGKVRVFAHDPWAFTGITDEGVMALRFLLAGMAVYVWLGQTRYARHAAAAAVVTLTVGAVALEATQFIITARSPAAEDAFVMAAAACAGVGLARAGLHRAPPGVLMVLLLGATAVSAAMETLSPFALSDIHRDATLVPFLNYYTFTSLEVLSHSFELLLMYFPLGFCLPLIVKDRRLGWRAVLVAVLVMACAMEYMQGWIDGRYSDVTDIGITLLGAMFGTWVSGAGWDLFNQATFRKAGVACELF